jgi:hypothetical protein
MRARTPIEACLRIATEHAAGTLAAIDEERAAGLAGELQDYGGKLVELGNERSIVESALMHFEGEVTGDEL